MRTKKNNILNYSVVWSDFMNTFADWHCDTASYICGKNMGFKDSDGHINIDMLEKYESPVQTFAVWLPKEYYKNAYDTTKMVIEYFKN